MERALEAIIRKLMEEEMLEREWYIDFAKQWEYKRAGGAGHQVCGAVGV